MFMILNRVLENALLSLNLLSLLNIVESAHFFSKEINALEHIKMDGTAVTF